MNGEAGNLKQAMTVSVECYSGVEYAERPRAVVWEGYRHEIVEVPGSWRTPEGKRFLVVTEEGQSLELSYDEVQDRWNARIIEEIP